MTTLDDRYPHLSSLVASVHGFGLERLADRAPAGDYDYFDLERLLAHERDMRLQAAAGGLDALLAQQPLGYVATIEAYVGLGVLKNRRGFVTQKLRAPAKAHAEPQGAQMLDTLAECSWGLWLHHQHGNLEEERVLPDGRGDCDFYVSTEEGPLWIDCISVAPTSDRFDLNTYFSDVVRKKWRTKFAARGATHLPLGIAVSVIKNQEHLIAALHFNETIGEACVPRSTLWQECPGLRHAWLATPPFHATPHHPVIFATWSKP